MASTLPQTLPQWRSLLKNTKVLLAFDAFGTLFHPRQPIEVQYSLVAQKHGVTGFTTSDLKSAFRRSFKANSARAPNYGIARGMGPEKWWSNVIEETFSAVVPDKVPPIVIEELLQRLSSREGYELYPDVMPFLKGVKELRNEVGRENIRTAVVTNSDPRVTLVLNDLGIRARSLAEFNALAQDQSQEKQGVDIDVVIHSSEIGVEKPNRRIFDAAVETVFPDMTRKEGDLLCIYIGDEMEKDSVGANAAGWHSILLDRERKRLRPFARSDRFISTTTDVMADYYTADKANDSRLVLTVETLDDCPFDRLWDQWEHRESDIWVTRPKTEEEKRMAQEK